MNKPVAVVFFCCLLVAVRADEDQEKYPKGRYCAHKHPEELRECVRHRGFAIVGEVCRACAKEVVPDRDLHQADARRDYFCREADEEVRKSYKACIRRGVSELDNAEEIRAAIKECYKQTSE